MFGAEINADSKMDAPWPPPRRTANCSSSWETGKRASGPGRHRAGPVLSIGVEVDAGRGSLGRPGARRWRRAAPNTDMPPANVDEEVGTYRQSPEAASRPTSCVSTTVTRAWCSPARTRSSSIRAGSARKGRRKAEPPADRCTRPAWSPQCAFMPLFAGEPAAAQTERSGAMSGRSPIGTLREDESIGSVSCRPSAKEVRMAPMRVGLVGMPMRQPSALVAIGVHWM